MRRKRAGSVSPGRSGSTLWYFLRRPYRPSSSESSSDLPTCRQCPRWSLDGERIGIAAQRHARQLATDTDGEPVSGLTRLMDTVSGPP